ncbi:hypothetical protein PVAND_005767 [Polypedilum vanderplanki]|uniref:Uncharacterized protein n=1 Tax=Polypedilum vanderplanki TaxID=319348 RepID=A0A9J6C157_POLVA|nr:hypothetical protein PVAND_005767 [Polypedilum vanderplanki]
MMKVALILLITFFVLNSHAGKNDKKHDKQKVTKPSSNHHNRNTTPSHHNHQNSTNLHQNHTSSHQSHQNQSDSHAVNPENIGWSLNSNNQAQHHNNPNGYALHSHEGSHHSQHSQMHPQHHDIQSSHQHQQIQPVQQQNQGSGIGGTLLGAGVGMASGALGGYLLANALNSGGSAEKISEHQTTIEAETTIQNAIATDQSTIAALEQSGSEVTTSNTINEINSISTNEVSQISEAISIEQSTTIAQEIQTSTQITKENNHAVGLKISLNIIIFCTLFLIFSE